MMSHATRDYAIILSLSQVYIQTQDTKAQISGMQLKLTA
jgi:hypothetical protein